MFLGVGSGSSGLSDFLNGKINFLGGSASDPVKDLTKKVIKSPGNAALRLQLAQAFDGKSRIDESVSQFEQYVKLKPSNVEGLSQLAGEYGKQAQQLVTQAQSAQQTPQTPDIAVLSTYLPAPQTSTLGQALTSLAVPLLSVTSLQQGQTTVLADRAKRAFTLRADAFRKLTRLQPDEPGWLFQIADTERQAGNTASAIAAYQQFIKTFPDDTADISIAKQYIKQLKSGTSAGTSSTSGQTG